MPSSPRWMWGKDDHERACVWDDVVPATLPDAAAGPVMPMAPAGLLLAGGRSTRMGTDKAMITLPDGSFAVRPSPYAGLNDGCPVV